LVSKKDLVKVLGRGEIKAAVEVKAHAFSATAIKNIEAVGGSAVKI
jgi:large subunit ribosomal protein L15